MYIPPLCITPAFYCSKYEPLNKYTLQVSLYLVCYPAHHYPPFMVSYSMQADSSRSKHLGCIHPVKKAVHVGRKYVTWVTVFYKK